MHYQLPIGSESVVCDHVRCALAANRGSDSGSRRLSAVSRSVDYGPFRHDKPIDDPMHARNALTKGHGQLTLVKAGHASAENHRVAENHYV